MTINVTDKDGGFKRGFKNNKKSTPAENATPAKTAGVDTAMREAKLGTKFG